MEGSFLKKLGYGWNQNQDLSVDHNIITTANFFWMTQKPFCGRDEVGIMVVLPTIDSRLESHDF